MNILLPPRVAAAARKAGAIRTATLLSDTPGHNHAPVQTTFFRADGFTEVGFYFHDMPASGFKPSHRQFRPNPETYAIGRLVRDEVRS